MKTSIIIPAAGMASRMKPLSNGISKCMIPVNGKPIISYIIDPLLDLDTINRIVIIQSSSLDVEEFIRRVYPRHLDKFEFVIQNEKRGPLHAVYIAWHLGLNENSSNDSILVWLGDTIIKNEKIIRGTDYLMTAKVPDWNRWCLVDSDNNFYDKPTEQPPTNEALVGVYSFSNGVLFNELIDSAMNEPLLNNEHQLSSLLKMYSSYQKFEIVSTTNWYDCGELNTYHESRAKLISSASRDFNHLSVDLELGILNKVSMSNPVKINREANWYKNLTPTQSLFAPRFITQEESGSLSMSWEPGTALSDMWVYENLKEETKILIINRIVSILGKYFHNQDMISLYSNNDIDKATEDMFITKNLNRISEFKDFPSWDKANEFIMLYGKELSKHPQWVECIHGDPHLGNILYEPISGKVNFVDPRGHFGSIIGTSGDARYDLGKLTQDIFGGYMYIIAGYYNYDTDTNIVKVRNNPEDSSFIHKYIEILETYAYNPREIFALSIILLLTCIPFHSDSSHRQLVIWNRGITLIEKFEKMINEKII